MSSSTRTSGPVDPTSLLSSPTSDSRLDERKAAEWAGLLLGALVPARPTLGLGATEPAASGASWPTSAPVLPTETSVAPLALSQGSDTSSVNDAGPTRLVLDVATETLGRLQLVVERDGDRLHVVIGGDAAARNALLLERTQLQDALGTTGLTVSSFRVVPTSEVGSVLAQGVSVKRERVADATRAPENETPEHKSVERNPAQRRKRLDLIG